MQILEIITFILQHPLYILKYTLWSVRWRRKRASGGKMAFKFKLCLSLFDFWAPSRAILLTISLPRLTFNFGQRYVLLISVVPWHLQTEHTSTVTTAHRYVDMVSVVALFHSVRLIHGDEIPISVSVRQEKMRK